jgi:hypothetical protein
MKIKTGQLWESLDRKEFRVIDIVNVEGNAWVHYINQQTGQEHSCYEESFKSRFNPVLNRN